ncbi:MAG: helix-turn-helix domain-containing protein [Clostridia bacterium]|nr:helix-turn-helix domain-containing protein [Clostridia bacterium]
MEFRDLLRHRRETLGLTLEDVGNAVGVSKTTVQRWESGNIKNLRRDKIFALAQILQLSTSALMGWDESTDLQTRNAESLSPMENELIDMFRKTTEHGRMLIISTVLSICDEEEKNAAPADQAHTAG